MVAAAISVLLGFAGWTFIPDFVAGHCLKYFHQLQQYRGKQVPQPRTPAWIRHYRYIFAAVVLGYLSYNLVEAFRTAPPNFFQILGVVPESDLDVISKAFRSFAKKSHPDRVGKGGEELFMVTRDAYEALKNPITRFAYERFGPDVLHWQECKTMKEYLKKGLIQGAGFYIGSLVVLLAMSALMKPSTVAYWRYLLLVGLFASELLLVVGYNPFPIFGLLFPHRIPFQHIRFLHQLFMFLSVALSRVMPVLFPESSGINAADPRTYAPYLDRLAVLGKSADREISRLLHTELHSIQGSKSTVRFHELVPAQPSDADMDLLTREMENMVVEHQLRSESPLRPLWTAAVERGREAIARARDRVSSRSRHRPAPLQRVSSLSSVKRGLPSPPGGSVSPELQSAELPLPVSVPPAPAANGHPIVGSGSYVVVGDDDGSAGVSDRLPSPRPSPPSSPSFGRTSSSPTRPGQTVSLRAV